jgi:hypothetical protein
MKKSIILFFIRFFFALSFFGCQEEFKRVFQPFSGRPFWELKFTNPDNSTSSYYRL